ncbi:hypothetical protein B0J14DRAFT_641094 [Halenospora varia]|nr:hypothetical protein B0J14DRAFT_641094 [Halenospora varia]
MSEHGRKRRHQTPEDTASKRVILSPSPKRPCHTRATPVNLTGTCEQFAICGSMSPSECQPPSQGLKALPPSGESIEDSDLTDTSKGLPTTEGTLKDQQPTEYSIRNPREADAPIDVNSKAVSTFTPPSDNLEIFFTIRDIALKYDLDNPIPASRVRELTLTEFFSLISQHADIPYSSITRLTFKVVFASHAVTQTELVVSKEAEDKVWAKVKKEFRRRYIMVMSTTPEQREFEVLVDVEHTGRKLD